MQKKFLGNLFFLILVNLLVKPFWILGIDREVQNITGSAAYGEYFVLFNLTLLLNILLDLGVTNYNSRNIAQNHQLLNQQLPGIIALKALLGVVYLMIVFIAAWIFQYSGERMELLVILALNQFLISFVMYLRSNIAALHLFKLDALLSVLDRLLMITICAAIIWGDVLSEEIDIKTFVYAQTAAYVITAIMALAVVLKKAPGLKFKVESAVILSIVRKSLPFAFLVLLMYFYHRMDTIMLDWMLEDGSYASGIYAQGYRLLDAYNMLAFLTAGILYPSFSKMIKEKVPTEDLMRLSFGILLSAAFAVSISCGLYADEIMSFLYDSLDGQSTGVFNYLIFASIPISISYVFGTLLTANGNLKTLNTIAFGGVILNFVLNYYLIPDYGAKGSALATLITQGAAVGAQVIAVFLFFGYAVNSRSILSVLIFLGFGTAAAMLIQEIDWFWAWKWIASLISLGIISMLSGVLKPEGLKRLLPYQK